MAVAALVCAVAWPAHAQDEGDSDRDIDWSIALRGSYASSSTTGAEADAEVAPAFTLTRNSERGATTISGNAAVSVDAGGRLRTNELRLSGASTYELDEDSGLKGNGELSLTQASPNDSSLPAGTAVAPLEFTGTAAGSATRRFGRFDVTGTLTGERYTEGPTQLDDGSSIDNTDQAYWLGQAGLRLGYELSPLLTVFVEGTEAQQWFDAPSPDLGVTLNGRISQLRGGFSYALDGTLSAEVSAGRAWYDYDDPAVTDQPGWVADASVTLTPDETLSLTGALNSSIGPSEDTPGDTDVGYTLSAEASYRLNRWLALRGNASWNRTDTIGTGDVAWGYSAGVGLDLITSRRTVWSADYLFSHDVPAGDPASDTHTVTLGVTFKR